MNEKYQIGLGGGCHWCTEGLFQSLIGVKEVKQGWISAQESEDFSEAVVIEYDPEMISAQDLIEIHLYTHACTSSHAMRDKYRSAVYAFSEDEKTMFRDIIRGFQKDFDEKIITKAYTFKDFKINKEDQLNYLYTRKDNQFCERYIHPKLTFLLEKFREKVDEKKIETLNL